jgi:cytochrome c
MARYLALTAALGVLALGACGKSQQSNAPEAPAAPSEPASAPAPAALTDTQKKTLLAELPAAYQAADLGNGEAKFAVCAACHTTAQGGADMTGPNLWGIFGRKAGSEASFNYSDDLKGAGWTWDADHIDKWITNPRAVLPGTKMTFLGLAEANDRRDVVAYLKVSTSPPPAS